MPYAANGQISRAHIPDGIEITEEQYSAALDGMLAGNIVSIDGGFSVGPAPKPESRPEPVPEQRPASITRRQGRLALLYAGKLAAVESAIATIADPTQQMAAQIEYENATWERGNPWIEQLGAQIGLTPADIDQLFITAANL